MGSSDHPARLSLPYRLLQTIKWVSIRIGFLYFWFESVKTTTKSLDVPKITSPKHYAFYLEIRPQM